MPSVERSTRERRAAAWGDSMQRGAAELVSLLQHSGDPQSPLVVGSLWGSGSAESISKVILIF